MNEKLGTIAQALARQEIRDAQVLDYTDSGVECMRVDFLNDPNGNDSYENEAQPEYILDPATRKTFLKGKLLGKGGFARVHEVTNLSTNTVFAAKIIPKSRITKKMHLQKIAREILIHRDLQHIHVVGLLDFFEDNVNAYMILEHCARKSLVNVLKHRKTVSEPETRYYLLQLIDAVSYIHGQGIIHRDLKPGNMLLTEDMVVKVGDFGLATLATDDTRVTICGTPNYIAPEVLNKERYGYEADVWAIGCIMYTLLVGTPPFETDTLKETYKRIIETRFTIPRQMTSYASSLIRALLNPLPDERLKLSDITKSPFFTECYVPIVLSASCSHTAPMFPTQIKGASTQGDDGPLMIFPPYVHTTTYSSVPKEPKGKVGALQKPTVHRAKHTKQEAQMARPSVVEERFGQLDNEGHISKPKETNSVVCLCSEPHTLTRVPQGGALSTRVPTVPGTHIQDGMAYTSSVRHRLMNALCRDACGLIRTPTKAIALHKELLLTLRGIKSPDESRVTPQCSVWPLFISKWIDYSNKYGFGFLLSDNSVGIHFNDNTRISFTPDHRHVEFHDKRGKVSAHPVHSVPALLRDRYIILTNFTRYMDQHLIEGADLKILRAPKSKSTVPFMKRWSRSNTAIVMELSNGTLQLNFFQDHTKLVIHHSFFDYVVTYVDKERQSSSYYLRNIATHGCKPCVYERLLYALDVLYEFTAIDKKRE